MNTPSVSVFPILIFFGALLWFGGALLGLGKPVLTWAGAELGWTQAGLDAAYTETEVMARYAAAQSGDFIAYVGAMNKHIWLDTDAQFS